jgi:drug/metabolite transporter (DMT)-like permease
LEESSFDPFNHAENKGAELIPVDSSNQDDDGNHDIGLWWARGILLLVAILWGTNFASVKYLETLCFHPPCVHPPSEAALARFGLAGIVSIPLLISQPMNVILAGLECGLWVTLGYIAQALALSTISSGECAFICSLTVVVVPMVNAICFGKPIKKISIISAILALSGVGVLEGLVDTSSLLGIQPALADSSEMVASTASTVAATGFLGFLQKMGIGNGDLLAILQPIGFGVSFIRIEHYVEKFSDVKNRVLTIAAAECVAVGLLSLFWVLYDFHGVVPNMEYMMDPHRLAAIAWTGIVTTVGAIYLEGLALETASATDAALTFASEPVWASLFGAWLLHEKLNLNAYLGGAVILVACLMSALADLPPPNDNGNDGNAIETNAN